MKDELLFAHGGYHRLKTFQLASLVYELTELFVRRYMEPNSRTCDQMIQAARSGMPNIAEGSVDSGTSKKNELHLTNIARGSLEELNNDYRHFSADRSLPVWEPHSALMLRLRRSRCRDINALRHVAAQLVRELSDGLSESDQSDQSDQSDKGRLPIRQGMSANNYVKSDTSDWSDWSDKKSVMQTPQTLSTSPDRPQTPAFPHLTKERIKQTVAVNCAIMLISQTCFLLDKQINRLSDDFINNGGFSERLSEKRRGFCPQQ